MNWIITLSTLLMMPIPPAAAGATLAATPADAIKACTITFAMLADPEVAERVAFQADGVISAITPGKGCAPPRHSPRSLIRCLEPKTSPPCTHPELTPYPIQLPFTCLVPERRTHRAPRGEWSPAPSPSFPPPSASAFISLQLRISPQE